MANCAATTVGVIPLTGTGTSPHEGVPLGLYPGGTNVIPPLHLAAGIALAAAVVPRNAAGVPKNNGKIGLLSIGMSNTRHEFAVLPPASNPKVRYANGAQLGVPAEDWADPNHECWQRLTIALTNAGLSDAQVQVVWMKNCTQEPTGGWPEATDILQANLRATVLLLAARFPNLKIVYLSSRVYGGYCDGPGNPEPYAYDGGFAVRGLIGEQLDGQLPSEPWLAWGPYLWADGLTPREGDGLIWECANFLDDGLHPSASGKAKVAGLLYDFLSSDPTALPWFVGTGARRKR